MNYRGSYRKLLGNSQAAILGAIEIYNKPQFEYRDECFVILLINGWELGLKACLSKNKQSIFYPKERHQPYRTLSLVDALKRTSRFLPAELPGLAIRKNLELLVTYRDNSIHFYNSPGFGTLIYALAQTSIVNYKDFVRVVFGVDLAQRMNWQLLPIGLRPPLDPIEYIGGIRRGSGKSVSPAIGQFIDELASAVKEIQESSMDAGRLLTVFSVKLESTKKIDSADVVVGLTSPEKPDGSEGPLAFVKTQDPNVTHPLRRKDILQQIGSTLTAHQFDAVSWKHNIKTNRRWCWQATEGVLIRYSRDILPWLRSLSESDKRVAVEEYKQYLKSRRKHKSEKAGPVTA